MIGKDVDVDGLRVVVDGALKHLEESGVLFEVAGLLCDLFDVDLGKLADPGVASGLLLDFDGEHFCGSVDAEVVGNVVEGSLDIEV